MPNARRSKPKVRLLLDSGAFSAWNRKVQIDLHEYMRFIKEHLDLVDCYVSLDVIGRSASQSYENQQIMKAEGLEPIPVFHQGERFKWLERYLENGEKYIGIATHKDSPPAEQRKWLDSAFTRLTDSKGRPYRKVHGFGITSFDHLVRYPWYSTDSTTWSLTPAYGTILVPPYVSGAFDYSKAPSRIIMSGIMQESPSSRKRQFELLESHSRKLIEQFLDQVGVSLSEARYDDNARRKVTLHYFSEFCRRRSVKSFKYRKFRFDDGLQSVEYEKVPNEFVIFHVATTATKMFDDILTEFGAWDRLLSYFYVKNRPKDYLRYYVQHGIGPPSKSKETKPKLFSSSYFKRRRLQVAKRAEQYDNET